LKKEQAMIIYNWFILTKYLLFIMTITPFYFLIFLTLLNHNIIANLMSTTVWKLSVWKRC